jgi:glycosyltransferase involved in cell wall biosynthesis
VAEASRTAHVVYGYDLTRMVVVPNGFDLSWTATADQRAILRAQCGFGAIDVVIGSLARFHPVKDPENFVRAACLLAQKHECVRFMMVGRNMDAGNVELARWIAGTGYANRFVLLGERADVPACLKSMDIFCLHSRTEGFPNAVGEAMVMGLPCIVTDVGDAALLVADRSMVVPKEDSRALAHALERLLTMEPEARCRLGREAKARIQADFTIRRTRERFEQVYANVFASCKLID